MSSLSELQLEERKLGIGGSDAPIILGYSKTTPLELYYQKLGIRELVFPEQIRESMEWGNRLEPVILDAYIEKTGLNHVKPIYSLVHQQEDLSFMRCNLDFMCLEHNLIGEIKSVGYMFGDEWGNDSYPLRFRAQLAHNRIVSESYFNMKIPTVHLVVFHANSLKVYFYHSSENEGFEANLIRQEKAFWECVVSKTPPPETNLSDVRLNYPNSNGETKIAKGELLSMWSELCHIRSKNKEYSSREDEIKTDIGKFMQDSPYLIDSDGNRLASFKEGKRGRTMLINDK